MKKFKYRTPRFSVDLPVQFTLQNSVLAGRCREIGVEGMTVELKPKPANKSRGIVSLVHLDRTIELAAQVAHVVGIRAGLAFIYESESERNAVAHFVASLAESNHQVGPVLLS
jgi:UDP-3-O-acyl-N-acetylglucosamine deacetylase